jgi:hypothetical protein
MPRPSKTGPQIISMPAQKMAVVKGKGSPDKVFAELMPALYGSVFTLKFDLKKRGLPVFKVSGLRARYPFILNETRDSWTIHVGLPVPGDTVSLPQKVDGVEVELETWTYGTVGQVLHLGTYSAEEANINRLLEFIRNSGYEIAGPHEEEYLTRPDAKVPKTIIRYEIQKKK